MKEKEIPQEIIQEYNYYSNIIIVGETSVGKSSIFNRYGVN